MKICAVIMAGGIGSRFWPESRERRPKQLLEVITKGQTLVQATIERTAAFVDIANTLVVTSAIQRPELERQLPLLPKENIISEPFGRNTAPCIALASHILKARLGQDAVMIVLPADHVIKNANEFTRLMKLGCRLANETRG